MEKVKWIVVILILFMAAGAGVYCWYLPQTHAADENNEPALEEGQEYAYAKITSILGNEMTYVELEAQTVDFNDLREKGGADENASGAKRDMAGQREERVSDGEKTSDGDMKNMPTSGAEPNMEGIPSSGTISNIERMPTTGGESSMEGIPTAAEVPNIGNVPTTGTMPDMEGIPATGAMPDKGNMPTNSAAARAGRSGVQKNSAQDKTDYTQAAAVMTYSETDVTGQIQIPVGTEVETKLGTVTTFSRLSNGDIIKMLLQKDDTGSNELMKIWIVE